jgi:hypothetical protein
MLSYLLSNCFKHLKLCDRLFITAGLKWSPKCNDDILHCSNSYFLFGLTSMSSILWLSLVMFISPYSYLANSFLFFLLSWPSFYGLNTLKRNNTENWKQIFPEKELPGHSSNFHIHARHSCVCERFICSHHQSASSAAGNMWTDPENK